MTRAPPMMPMGPRKALTAKTTLSINLPLFLTAVLETSLTKSDLKSDPRKVKKLSGFLFS